MDNKKLKHILCADCLEKYEAVLLAEVAASALSEERERKKLGKRKKISRRKKNKLKRQIAEGMRILPTPAERTLRQCLDICRRSNQWDIENQKQIGPYIVDFAITNKRTVIEVDGAVHDKNKEYDRERDRYLSGNKWHVLHFTNEEVLRDPFAIVRKVEAFLKENLRRLT